MSKGWGMRRLGREPAPLERTGNRNAAQAPTTFWNLHHSEGEPAPLGPGPAPVARDRPASSTFILVIIPIVRISAITTQAFRR